MPPSFFYMASVTLYKNTGFNTINIPDSKTLLAQNASIQTTAFDLIQNKFLSSITCKISWTDAQQVDYANVDDFYYIVTGVTMTSADVAQFSLTPDFILSAGGAGSLDILDGITERHHIPKGADSFGAYDEPDSLLSPAQPLELEFGNGLFMYGDALDSLDYYTVCESSIDLVAMGKLTSDYPARTFSDGENSVTVPRTYAVQNFTTFKLQDGLQTQTSGTCLFDVSDSNVQRGMQMARDLGVEDAIIGQYALPKNMFNVTATDGFIEDITSTTVTGTGVGMPYEYTTCRNERCLYGENNRYGLLTAAGNSYEANPEQLKFSGVTEPTIIYRGDGRENGKPYYNFGYYMGQSNNNMKAFFRNAVAGMEWRNVPLRFTTAAHSVQDTYNFNSQRDQARAARNNQVFQNAIGITEDAGNVALNAANTYTSAVLDPMGIFGDNAMENALNTWQSGMTLASDIGQAIYNTKAYKLQRQNEIYNFGVSQNVVEPTIKFPFQTPSIRDYMGNGVISYRYHYTPTDISRIDKILTAYGYHITEQLTTSMFNNRPHFNFVKASGVTVGGNLPTWWKNGISQQFGAGVRIWHVKPASSYYTQNE